MDEPESSRDASFDAPGDAARTAELRIDLTPPAAGALRTFVNERRDRGFLDKLLLAAHETLNKSEMIEAIGYEIPGNCRLRSSADTYLKDNCRFPAASYRRKAQSGCIARPLQDPAAAPRAPDRAATRLGSAATAAVMTPGPTTPRGASSMASSTRRPPKALQSFSILARLQL